MSTDVRIDDRGLAEFLRAIARIPSINPPGGEGPVAELIAGQLRDLGFGVEVFEAAPGRPSVVAKLPGRGQGPSFMLNGHMDVQPAGGGWKHDPFGAEMEGDRLFGRGVIDMKAGLAAMVFAAAGVVRSGVKLKGNLVIAAVADEVCGGHQGTGFLTRTGRLKTDMAIVCEPTGDSVNVAHRGTAWIEVEVTGRSAHGGRPWLGVNAISKATKIVRAIEEKLVPSLQHLTHPLLPAPTINVGAIRGGTKFNLVADQCTFELDRRMVPGESAEDALKQVDRICAEVRAADSEAFTWQAREIMHVNPSEISAEAPIVRACQRAYREVVGREPGIGSTAGFEDMHFLMDAGIPTAMFGPYRPQQPKEAAFFTTSGMPDEYVDMPDVVMAASIYARLIENILG